MIDFRYHLVSILSFFLALAVGIALGAGPLKGTIPDTITKEVTSLRSDKAALNSQLSTANAGTRARDAYITATEKSVLAGRLAGQTVDLVVLPGADKGLVSTLKSTLVLASATIGTTVTLDASWAASDMAATSDRIATEVSSALGLPAGTGSSLPLVDQALAGTLRRTGGAAATTTALKAFTDAGLLHADADVPAAANAFVVVGAPVVDQVQATRDAEARAYASVAAALAAGGGPTVLASDVGVAGPADNTTSVVEVARGSSSLTHGLSTVDDIGVPLGQATVVIALLALASGTVGNYGLSGDASAVFPVVPGLTTP